MIGETESIKSISGWIIAVIDQSKFLENSYLRGMFGAYELVLRDEIRLECIKQGLI